MAVVGRVVVVGEKGGFGKGGGKEGEGGIEVGRRRDGEGGWWWWWTHTSSSLVF